MKFPHVRGLSVELHVNGQPLDEFDDISEDPSPSGTTIKYVEATSGVNFSVAVHFLDDFQYSHDDIECCVSLDGKYICGRLFDRKQVRLYHITGRDTLRKGSWMHERFAFTDLNTDDGPAKGSLMKALKDLGSVTVEFTRVVKGREIPPTEYIDSTSTADSSIPEKSLKGRAISNRAKLSQPAPIPKGPKILHTDYPYGNDAFAISIFKYRSRRDLQIEGMLPRSPSPLPLEERDPGDLSVEEAREAVRRLRARGAPVKQELIKHEKRDREPTVISDNEDSDDVLIYAVNTTRKRQRQSGIEVIDLSTD